MNRETKILVVEDRPTQARMLEYLLTDQGYQVTVKGNGKEGLDAARKDIPALIISDIVMPVMNGYQLCSEVRDDVALKDVLFILVTSLSNPKDAIRGFQSGADSFIVKPYSREDLVSTIQDILATRKLDPKGRGKTSQEIIFQGEKFSVPSDGRRILGLLLSTYRNAAQKNLELVKTQDGLRTLNENLEEKVKERTVALEKEITERTQAQRALQESDKKFRDLVEYTNDVIWEMDQDGVYSYISPQVEHILGYRPEELIGKTLFDFMPDEEQERIGQIFRQTADKQEPFMSLVHKSLCKHGELVFIECSGTPIIDGTGKFQGYRGVDRDITERKRLEEQLVQAQKMEAVGTLAGGVAHDFNNLLSVVLGYAELLLDKLPPDFPMRGYLKQIYESVEQGKVLADQLLTFSRKQPLEMHLLNLNDPVGRTVKILPRVIPENIEVNFVAAPDLGQVRGDANQMEQTILNLVLNARDAMLGGGKINIATANVKLEDEYTNTHLEVEPGPYVQLSITDNGKGMDEATRKRIFEPFFTTKEIGKGTGLGLSAVHGIVKGHGGHIWVYSEPSLGTTFKIYLPRLDAPAEQSPVESKETDVTQGSETILVAEDEEGVRGLVQNILEGEGYKLLCASTVDEAQQIFRKHASEVDLLLIDVVMPGGSGPELYERLVKEHPGLKVLYMSGYTDKDILQKMILDATYALPPKAG